ncbi:hypothetical protein M0R45_019294 [Rubus argutus]|uniref:Tryptophan synthase beta chain-like PALP domain-containing protein n=1 Tax=Rubus argutus TaxID=59490 RepID=A0AAW1X6R8_RUBAR
MRKELHCLPRNWVAMPVTTPEIKWQSVERLGATVVLLGDSYHEAQAYAKKLAKEEGRSFIPPFDHPDIIMGQGTVGMEVMREDYWCGAGVEPPDANAMALSLHHGERITLDQVGGFADGVAVKEVGEETFRLCKELIDGVVLISRDAICGSIEQTRATNTTTITTFFNQNSSSRRDNRSASSRPLQPGSRQGYGGRPRRGGRFYQSSS